MTDDSNGRVTIAVLGNKIDSLTSVVLQTNANLTDVGREVGEIRTDIAVNEERWVNHKDLHKRERSVLGAVSAALSTAAAAFSVWWNGK